MLKITTKSIAAEQLNKDLIAILHQSMEPAAAAVQGKIFNTFRALYSPTANEGYE